MSGSKLGLSSKEDVLSSQEKTMLMACPITPRDRFIIFTLLLAGLRVSELVHFRRSWFNPDEGTITIPRKQNCNCWECRQKRHGEWRTKTKAGQRAIILHPMLVPIITKFLEQVIDDAKQPNALGLTRQRVWQRIRELAGQTHIGRNLYPHCLRSTSATDRAFLNVSAPTLQHDFGWERLTSAEEYVKSDEKRAQKEMREIYATVKS